MQAALWTVTAVTFSLSWGLFSVDTRSSPRFSRMLLASLLLGAIASVLVLTDMLLRRLSELWFAIGPIAALLVHLASRSAKSAATTV